MRLALPRSLLVLSLAISPGAAACSRAAGSFDATPPVLTFVNESLDVVTVYGLRPGGDATRLATVSPGRAEVLRLTAGLSTGGTITIVAVPMAGNRASSSGPISIGPGTRLEITLPSTQNVLTVLPIP